MESLSEHRIPTVVPRHTTYVANPVSLLADLADSPAAIGVYTLIGRRYAISQTPVPLSARDVTRLDATLTYGAAVRALERLTTSGWAIEQRRDGWKSTYVPTWGRVKGALVPWQIGAARNGRPAHIHQVKVDVRLLDTYIGRIVPHERHPAQITRYLTAPLLSLRDVGVYALACSGRREHTAALARWGLVRDGFVHEPLSDDEIIAYASQLCLHDPASALTLTEHGLRVLGPVHLVTQQPGTSTTLFFVDKGVIGRMIGDVIGQTISTPITPDHSAYHTNAASGSSKAPRTKASDSAPCIESIRSKSCISTPTAGGDHYGSRVSSDKPDASSDTPKLVPTSHPPQVLPDTPTTQLLRSINVRPAQMVELAHIPIELVHAAVQDAQSRLGLRDQAGWVVKMLRDWRDHGWQIRPPSTPGAIDWRALAAEYGCPSDMEAVTTVFPAFEAVPDAAQTTVALRSYLYAAVERKHRPVIDGLASEIRGDVAIITCTTIQQRDSATTMLAPAIRSWLDQYCDGGTVQFVLRSSRPVPGSVIDPQDAPAFACPAWLSEAQWQQLGVVVCSVLQGSTRQDGVVRGRTPHIDSLIATRYRNEVQQLLALQSS